MAIIKMINAYCLFGRNKLLNVFKFYFEEDLISI